MGLNSQDILSFECIHLCALCVWFVKVDLRLIMNKLTDKGNNSTERFLIPYCHEHLNFPANASLSLCIFVNSNIETSLFVQGSKHQSHQDYLERADKARSERLSAGTSTIRWRQVCSFQALTLFCRSILGTCHSVVQHSPLCMQQCSWISSWSKSSLWGWMISSILCVAAGLLLYWMISSQWNCFSVL